MATKNSMASRIQRVQASARRKNIEALEASISTAPFSRAQKIAALEAELKTAAKAKSKGIKSESTDKDDGNGKKPSSKKKVAPLKSESTDKDDGKGKKPSSKGTESKSKRQLPAIKGNRADAKLDKGINPLTGKGSKVKSTTTSKQKALSDADKRLKEFTSSTPTKNTTTSKQKALRDADQKRKELTSEMPKLKATPKPKLSSVQEDWRKKRIAALRLALSPTTKTAAEGAVAPMPQATKQRPPPVPQNPAKPIAEGDIADTFSDKQLADGEVTPASKEQKVPAQAILEQSQKFLPIITQDLTAANDALEDAILGGKLPVIQKALNGLMKAIQDVSKVPFRNLAQSVSQLMKQLSGAKTASSNRRASITKSARLVSAVKTEFARSKQLMHMAANRISI